MDGRGGCESGGIQGSDKLSAETAVLCSGECLLEAEVLLASPE